MKLIRTSAVYYVNTLNGGDATIEFIKDIDLSKYKWASMGWYYNCASADRFHGTFIGNNHTIKGLHIEENDYLIRFLGRCDNCKVQDLTIKDAVIIGNDQTAILAGKAESSSFTNCTVSGTVTGSSYTGSLLGYAEECTITKCKADATVNGEPFQDVINSSP